MRRRLPPATLLLTLLLTGPAHAEEAVAPAAPPASAAEEAARRIERLVGESANFLDTVRAVDAEIRMLGGPARTPVAAGAPDRRDSDGVLAGYYRWRWYWQDRVRSDGSYPDLNAIYAGIAAGRRVGAPGKSGAAAWVNINETTTVSGYVGMGRTTDIAFHPSDPDVFFVASPRGGLWKTEDGGATYQPISDSLPFVSLSNVVVDPADADVIYVAIGDNVWYGPPSSGIYKTTDGGQSWNPTALTFAFEAGTRVWDLIAHPAAPGTLLAATSAGVYRTTDGFATHSRVFSTDTRDLAFRPGDPATVYLASNGSGTSEVFKSSDGGATWTRKSALNSGGTEMHLAVSPAAPSLLGVLTIDGRFYRSTDAGESFVAGGNAPGGGQLVISAGDPDVMYSGNLNVYRSEDAGDTWDQMTIWYDGHPTLTTVHADQRNVEINPLLPDGIYWCNDGGLYRYRETPGAWADLSDGLVITQYYKISNSQSDPRVVTGGTQDNGGRIRREDLSWGATNGGDAMEVAIDPSDPDVLFTEYVFGNLYRSLDGWRNDAYHSISDNITEPKQADWVMPFELSPQDPHTIVAGYDRVWRSTDRGDNWTAISDVLAPGGLDHVALAPGNAAVVYAADSGYNGDAYGGGSGVIFRTANLGGHWTQATPLPTSNRITGIDVADHDPLVLLASVSGYTEGEKLFVTRDGGGSWTNVSGSLPNVPANDVRLVPGARNSIYVATDVGVYYRDDTLTDWEIHGENLPMVSVVDIDFQHAAELVRIGTHGRGMYEAPLRKLDREYCVPEHTECCDAFITRVRLDSFDHDSAGPTSIGTRGFSDFTPESSAVAAGQVVNLTVSSSVVPGDARVGAWIDWDRDGQFESAERVDIEGGPGPWTGTVSVPAGAPAGPTTLRVRLMAGTGAPVDPCAASGQQGGETEDHTVLVAVDTDGDTIPDLTDAAPGDPQSCRDQDADGCDDCVSGIADLQADGPDADADGLCDIGDPDIDGDGYDNAQDCAPLDGAIHDLPLHVGGTLRVEFVAADTVRLHWRQAIQSRSSNVYAGSFVPGQPWTYNEACLAAELSAPRLEVPAAQASGTATYYLVSARNPCGDSRIGVDPDGLPRHADPECPTP